MNLNIGKKNEYWLKQNSKFKKQLRSNRLKTLKRNKTIMTILKYKTQIQKSNFIKSIGAW